METRRIYRNPGSLARWTALLLLVIPGSPDAGGDAHVLPASDLLIDDFSREDGASARGTRWRGFSDRVMGGVSLGTADLDTLDGTACLRLRGRVSLENGGGFIQVALDLDPEGDPLDASGFAGVRVLVRGNGESGYHLHLRTTDTRRPWQYYDAPFAAGDEWTEVRIPFTAFTPRSLGSALRTGGLLRIAVVASKGNFDADVAVARISLYRDTV